MMYLTQAVHRAAQINGSGTATLCDSRRRTWREVAHRIGLLAGAMTFRQFSPGSRVAIIALNSDAYLEAYYTIFWLGAVAVPVNTRWSEREILDSLDETAPLYVMFDERFSSLVDDMRLKLPYVKMWIFIGSGQSPDWAVSAEALIQEGVYQEDCRIGGANLAAVYYTGGTTGVAKGVMLSHDNIMSSALSTAAILRYSENTRLLHVAPMFHMADASMMFSATCFSGGHVFLDRFEPALVCETIARDKVTHLLLVPTMIKMLIDHQEQHGADFGSVEQITYGTSPISEVVLARALEVFPNARFVQAYGQTELSPTATMLEPQFHTIEGQASGKLRSAGRAVPMVDLKIFDREKGIECPPGTIGEVLVRGPNVMQGYWKQPHVTEQTIVNGWLHTGDVAYMDEDGFIYVVDRVKDMIISGGENVYSAEVENAILSHPHVSECAVIGMPDDHWGERVHAILSLKTGKDMSLDALVQHCRALIAGYKCPRSFEITADPLPRTAAGKINKVELRKASIRGSGEGDD